MKAFIIEDEIMAREMLARTVQELFPDIEIAGSARSIADAVAWLRDTAHSTDLIFMDVELLDGKCFEIFKRVEIKAPVIMTTAYDNYAVKAFEVNSVDYLLKPIEPAALRRAVERCRERGSSGQSLDVTRLVAALQGQLGTTKPTWKETLIVQFGDHLVPLKTADIAFIYSGDKYNHIVTSAGEQYMIDESLDATAAKLDPRQFFKISRSAIVSRNAIGSLSKLMGGRLRIELTIARKATTIPSPEVSRSNTASFLSWLDE